MTTAFVQYLRSWHPRWAIVWCLAYATSALHSDNNASAWTAALGITAAVAGLVAPPVASARVRAVLLVVTGFALIAFVPEMEVYASTLMPVPGRSLVHWIAVVQPAMVVLTETPAIARLLLIRRR